MREIDKMRLNVKYDGKIPKNVVVRENFSILFKSLKEKMKYVGAVISGKRLADNKEYEGAPKVSQQIVEENPRRWIIEECIPACQILWSKNIYTFMCSDQLDANAWIELIIDNLSSENLEILEQIKREYDCYQYHKGCINISVKGMGKSAQNELLNIANRFLMQDVPCSEAILSEEELLIKCGCTKSVLNPNYIPFEEQLRNMNLGNWNDIDIQDEYLIVLDRVKVNKTLLEYANQVGAVIDFDTGVIYSSEFHYEKHLNYINYLKSLSKRNKSL